MLPKGKSAKALLERLLENHSEPDFPAEAVKELLKGFS
jgi:hypothetical protein